jgi:3-dehydrosphinganine reductase
LEPNKTVVSYFRDKCVLVTGGNSGIGLATARLLRACGSHLILVARRADKLAEAQQALALVGPSGVQIHTLSLDVGDRAAVERALEKPPSERPVDVLISNAGVVMPGQFIELPITQFEEQMRTNYFGAVYVTKALLPGMVKRGQGHVAYVSSLLGLMGIFGYTAYAPTKFALRGLAEVLRSEMKPRNIRVSVCFPPDTDTPQHEFEKPFLPPETRAVAGNVKTMSADAVASALLKGMASGCFDIVPGGSTKFANFMYRIFPGMVRSMLDGDVRKAAAREKPAKV